VPAAVHLLGHNHTLKSPLILLIDGRTFCKLGGEDRVGVGLVESVVFHAIEEEADERCASTADEKAAGASEVVDNDRIRVAPGRERRLRFGRCRRLRRRQS